MLLLKSQNQPQPHLHHQRLSEDEATDAVFADNGKSSGTTHVTTVLVELISPHPPHFSPHSVRTPMRPPNVAFSLEPQFTMVGVVATLVQPARGTPTRNPCLS